jgi:CheY-like chemotaxis protein
MKPLNGKRVLIVEDEAIIAAMVEDMLTELGATVVGPASTIKNALILATFRCKIGLCYHWGGGSFDLETCCFVRHSS